MDIYDLKIPALDGSTLDMDAFRGKATLVVNVASRCGLTPQYEALEQLHERYADRGFSVLGVPCDQFAHQEPGDAEDIATFCSTTYGVTFPMTAKLEVNGRHRHPLFEELTRTPDADGNAGDVQWNFEKFLLAADGSTLHRYRPKVLPDSEVVLSAIEAALP